MAGAQLRNINANVIDFDISPSRTVP